MRKYIRHHFELKLKIKGSKRDLGQGKGIVTTAQGSIDIPERVKPTHPHVVMTLLRLREDFLQQNAEVQINWLGPRQPKKAGSRRTIK